MKNLKKKVSAGILSLLSCCSAISAKENLGLEKNKLSKDSCTQQDTKFLGKKRKRSVGENVLTGLRWGAIVGGIAVGTAAVDRVVTGRSFMDVIDEKLNRSYIEKNFDKLVSPYMDINHFKNGGPNNVKEYLIDIMAKGYTEFLKEGRLLKDDKILPYSLALEFDLIDLFQSSTIGENTAVALLFSGNKSNAAFLNSDSLGIQLKVAPIIDGEAKFDKDKATNCFWGLTFFENNNTKNCRISYVYYDMNQKNQKNYCESVLNAVGAKILSRSLKTKENMRSLPEFILLVEKVGKQLGFFCRKGNAN